MSPPSLGGTEQSVQLSEDRVRKSLIEGLGNYLIAPHVSMRNSVIVSSRYCAAPADHAVVRLALASPADPLKPVTLLLGQPADPQWLSHAQRVTTTDSQAMNPTGERKWSGH